MKANLFAAAAWMLALPLLLVGCARGYDMTANFLASDVPVYAIVGERLLSGRAVLYNDRTGSLTLDAKGETPVSCMGTLRYTATASGVVTLRCSDGVQAQFPFAALGEISGQGSGRTAQGSVSLAYGLDPEPARAWLTPPPGKRLVAGGDGLRLE
jgi:hypothetical protein